MDTDLWTVNTEVGPCRLVGQLKGADISVACAVKILEDGTNVLDNRITPNQEIIKDVLHARTSGNTVIGVIGNTEFTAVTLFPEKDAVVKGRVTDVIGRMVPLQPDDTVDAGVYIIIRGIILINVIDEAVDQRHGALVRCIINIRS